MTLEEDASTPRHIVVIGGGVIGCSTAYFLTHHRLFDPKLHNVTILEASSIAGGSSGKAGGLLAEWATPKCLAPLSFQTHAALARKHGGDRIWGYRNVYCADVKLQAQSPDLKTDDRASEFDQGPPALDWLLPGALKSYKEVGATQNSAQVNPYMFTTTLAKLAEEAGAKVVQGSATRLKYEDGGKRVEAVEYTQNGSRNNLKATDTIIAAGPWTPRIFPPIHLEAPRGHSVVIRPTRALSPYVLFPEISAPSDGSLTNVLSPEIYPRPGDALLNYNTVYASGPDDYEAPLPDDTGRVEVEPQKCEDVWTALRSVSGELRAGEVITRQACYKPQIPQHEEDEEFGPIVGPIDGPSGSTGVWVATGHDEWGIQNAAGTGLVLSEMILEGEAKSADCKSLHPRNFMDKGIPVNIEDSQQAHGL